MVSVRKICGEMERNAETALVEMKNEKVLPKLIGVGMAMNAVMMQAFAEGGSGVDISAVTESMTSSLSDLVSQVAVACAGIVGVGLTIFGIKWVVKTVKSFFSKIAG